MAKTLFDELKSFSQAGFREIYRKFIYIHCRELLDIIFPEELDQSITGVIAYCYIDRAEGISFRPFLVSAMKEDSLQVFNMPHQEDTIYVLRLRDGESKMSELHSDDRHMYLYAVDPVKYSFLDLAIVNFDTESFIDMKEQIDDSYSAGDMVEDLRSETYAFLDQYRNEFFPDDVQALLYSEKNGIEQVWVRLTFMTMNDEIFGELLNEPYRDYGCHKGTLIELTEAKAGEDKVLVFTGRMAEMKKD